MSFAASSGLLSAISAIRLARCSGSGIPMSSLKRSDCFISRFQCVALRHPRMSFIWWLLNWTTRSQQLRLEWKMFCGGRLSELRLADRMRLHRGLDPRATVDPKFVSVLNGAFADRGNFAHFQSKKELHTDDRCGVRIVLFQK